MCVCQLSIEVQLCVPTPLLTPWVMICVPWSTWFIWLQVLYLRLLVSRASVCHVKRIAHISTHPRVWRALGILARTLHWQPASRVLYQHSGFMEATCGLHIMCLLWNPVLGRKDTGSRCPTCTHNGLFQFRWHVHIYNCMYTWNWRMYTWFDYSTGQIPAAWPRS